MTSSETTAYYRELKEWVSWWYTISNVRKIPDHLKTAIKAHARHWATKGTNIGRSRDQHCADLIQIHANEVDKTYRFTVCIVVPALSLKEAYSTLHRVMNQLPDPLDWEADDLAWDPDGMVIDPEDLEEARIASLNGQMADIMTGHIKDMLERPRTSFQQAMDALIKRPLEPAALLVGGQNELLRELIGLPECCCTCSHLHRAKEGGPSCSLVNGPPATGVEQAIVDWYGEGRSRHELCPSHEEKT